MTVQERETDKEDDDTVVYDELEKSNGTHSTEDDDNDKIGNETWEDEFDRISRKIASTIAKSQLLTTTTTTTRQEDDIDNDDMEQQDHTSTFSSRRRNEKGSTTTTTLLVDFPKPITFLDHHSALAMFGDTTQRTDIQDPKNYTTVSQRKRVCIVVVVVLLFLLLMMTIGVYYSWYDPTSTTSRGSLLLDLNVDDDPEGITTIQQSNVELIHEDENNSFIKVDYSIQLSNASTKQFLQTENDYYTSIGYTVYDDNTCTVSTSRSTVTTARKRDTTDRDDDNDNDDDDSIFNHQLIFNEPTNNNNDRTNHPISSAQSVSILLNIKTNTKEEEENGQLFATIVRNSNLYIPDLHARNRGTIELCIQLKSVIHADTNKNKSTVLEIDYIDTILSISVDPYENFKIYGVESHPYIQAKDTNNDNANNNPQT